MDVAVVLKAVGGGVRNGIASACLKYVQKDDAARNGKVALFRKADELLQIVWAEVLVPDVPDTVGAMISKVEVRKAAYSFAERLMLKQIDTQHDNYVIPDAAIVETFIARKGDSDFIEGSWVVGMHISDPETWRKVDSGELNSFSIEALGYETPKELSLYLPLELGGSTLEAVDHVHSYVVKFDEDGRFVGGKTSEANGHSHQIVHGTVTEAFDGHRHRYSLVEKLQDAAKESSSEGQ